MNLQENQKIIPLTVEEFRAIYGKSDDRYELIDGIVYDMASPKTVHQSISVFLTGELFNFLKGRKCRLFAAPYDVFLNETPKDKDGGLIKNRRIKGTIVQPDLMVICDKDKIKPDGCHGAPDFIIEILSESTKDRDRSPKLHKYFSSGVKEYWIIDPKEEIIGVYNFNPENKKAEFQTLTFEDKIKCRVLDGFEIDFAQFDLNEFGEI